MALTVPHIPQELLETTQVDPEQVEGMVGRLHSFARSFAPFFYRKEQAKLGEIYLEGLASDLHRNGSGPGEDLEDHTGDSRGVLHLQACPGKSCRPRERYRSTIEFTQASR
jgi:hypothetical protein